MVSSSIGRLPLETGKFIEWTKMKKILGATVTKGLKNGENLPDRPSQQLDNRAGQGVENISVSNFYDLNERYTHK